MYNAFGWQPPAFAHVGLLQDQDRQKLSKRKFDLSIRTFEQELGIFPEALINYVALLGWSHSQRSDFFSLQQLIDNFDMRFTKGNTIVTFGKLWHLQKHFAQLYAEQGGTEFDSIVDRIYSYVAQYSVDKQLNLILRERDLKSYLAMIVRVDAKNFTTVEDFYHRNAYFFEQIVHSDLEPGYQNQSFIHGLPILDLIKAAETISFVNAESWNSTILHSQISEMVTSSTEARGVLIDISSGMEERPSDVDQRAF
ncbi:MAG: Glutamate--tRNA ligase mitochondrial, partial [Pleopsidium flavum]